MRDGYVSLEVSPTLAHDTRGTLDEARRLWNIVGRPNLMMKVPVTPEGIPAIQRLISEGINVNVTLLFAEPVYEQVAGAFLAGLEDRQASGTDVSRIASVASFFISRIDTAVDALLTAKIEASNDAAERAKLRELLGKAVIASARVTYQRAQEIYSSARWKRDENHMIVHSFETLFRYYCLWFSGYVFQVCGGTRRSDRPNATS